MAIDYHGLRSLTARELIAALTHDGFYFVGQKGSHQRYRLPDGQRITVAPHAGGDTFTIKKPKIDDRIAGARERGRSEAPETHSLSPTPLPLILITSGARAHHLGRHYRRRR